MRIQNFTPSPGSIGPIQTNYPNHIFLVPATVDIPSPGLGNIAGWNFASIPNAKGGGLGIWLYQIWFDCVGGLANAVVNWQIQFPGSGLNFIEVAQGSFTVAAGVETIFTTGGMFFNADAASATGELQMSSTQTDTQVKGGVDPTKNTRMVVVQIGLGASS